MRRMTEEARHRPNTVYPDRYCECGKKLTRFNPNVLCYNCDDYFNDHWEEDVTLADEYRVGTKKDVSKYVGVVPPPMDGESPTKYVRRILVPDGVPFPVHSVCSYYGFSNSQVSSAVANAKKWYKRRGLELIKDEGYAAGYRLVSSSMV